MAMAKWTLRILSFLRVRLVRVAGTTVLKPDLIWTVAGILGLAISWSLQERLGGDQVTAEVAGVAA